MLRRIRAFARLAPADRRMVLRAIAALIAARWGVRLKAHQEPVAAGQDDRARAENIARLLVKTAGALPIRSSCLQRATALASLLRREGIACELRIAVRRAGATVHAHAWVEHDGVELLPRPDESYVAFEESLSLSCGDAPALRAPHRRA